MVVAILSKIVFMSIVCYSLIMCSPKTYDLVRYGRVDIIKQNKCFHGENRQEMQDGASCHQATNTQEISDVFKKDIWEKEGSWSIEFEEDQNEIDLDVNFYQIYNVHNFLLSFREANNISALTVEVQLASNTLHQVHYAASKLLCDFFFPLESTCHVKADLNDGVMLHFKNSLRGDRVRIRLFPPIVDNYDTQHTYSINQLFIGGNCSCNGNEKPDCVNTMETDQNGATRNVLICRHSNRHLIQGLDEMEVCTCSPFGTLYELCTPFIGITSQCPCKPYYEGEDCGKCVVGYYGYPDCKPCNCDYVGSISSECDSESGQCICEPRYSGLQCNKCSPGRFNFPFCHTCPCPAERTSPEICDVLSGKCLCQEKFDGPSCSKCKSPLVNFPHCHRPDCKCSIEGSVDLNCTSDGMCECKKNFTGKHCDQCAKGYGNYPQCTPCSCPSERTTPEICDPTTGKCLCLEKYDGSSCSKCKSPFINFPECHRRDCKCSVYGSVDMGCNKDGKCTCKKMYVGKQCNKCAKGFGNYPTCSPCYCDTIGSRSDKCSPKTGQCYCKENYAGLRCNQCKDRSLAYPRCKRLETCKCNVNGTKQVLNTNGPCVFGHSCLCKQNVIGNDCSKCKPNSYGLSGVQREGCIECRCSPDGSFGNLGSCDVSTGQCSCKPNVGGMRCDHCKEGFYGLDRWNLFGCTACNCNVGGSLNATCDDEGKCFCKLNFEGKKCNNLRRGPYFVPSYYHLKFEAEDGQSRSGTPSYRYSADEFDQFTGLGYITFGQEKSAIKFVINVPKTRKYRVLVRNLLKQGPDTTMLVNLQSDDRETSYAGVVDISPPTFPAKSPTYSHVTKSDGSKEFILKSGTWSLEMSSISADLLVDHIVLLPEEYYTGIKLQLDETPACTTTQPPGFICVMYKYIALHQFQQLQAETGTNSKGYGNEPIRRTNVMKRGSLHDLEIMGTMAELSSQQIALTLEVSVHTTDEYHIVVTYYNPDQRTYRLDMYDVDSGHRGQIEVVPCQYQFLCRLVIQRSDGSPLPFKYQSNKTSEITFLGNIRGTLLIDYLTFIPVSKWSADHIIPSAMCYKQDKACLQNVKFPSPDDAVEVKADESNEISSMSKTVHATSENSVRFTIPVMKREPYLLIYRFYQPSLPSFNIKADFKINERIVDSMNVQVPHCIANSGCRNILRDFDADSVNVFNGPITVVLVLPKGAEIWIDSMFLLPNKSFSNDLLFPKRFELTKKFKESCVNERSGLPFENPREEFCRTALMSLTSGFTDESYKCGCDPIGSRSSSCNVIGGQCQCKPQVAGRNCSRCQTGEYDFPNCKACNCFAAGSIGAECNSYGQCTCRPGYEGLRCGRCKNMHWGFPNCRECNCEPRGSLNLACRRSDGQCPCLRNFGGKQCKQCHVGYFNFPECRSCNCNPAGVKITRYSPTGCYKQKNNHCHCKNNVLGAQCDLCKPFYHSLNASNPLGCSPCSCSTFGTLSGAGPCNMETGRCLCRPNAAGKDCSTCEDGFYMNKTDHLFSCKPCLCSAGGSINNICNKETGQCQCKPFISGFKCNNVESKGYHLPPVAHYTFDGSKISPFSPKGDILGLKGTYVNSSYASVRMKFTVNQSASYHVMISYALIGRGKAKIELEFTSGDQATYIIHKFKAKRPNLPVGDFVKKGSAYLKLELTKGEWYMQALFQDTVFLNSVSLIPTKSLKPYRISKRIQNPCLITDNRRMCAMYSYYDLIQAKTNIFEIERELIPMKRYFNKWLYRAANINGAVEMTKERNIVLTKYISVVSDYYVIIQYLNIENTSAIMEIQSESSRGDTIRGYVTLYPCPYAFACRQVLLDKDSRKLRINHIERTRITMKITSGKSIYVDFISLIEVTKWASNILTPEFYCIRRLARCIKQEFPTSDNYFSLETKESLGVSQSSPPNSPPSIITALLSRSQRNLRWMSHMRLGGYYLIIHYYQPIRESFYSKVILTTYKMAVAGKIQFKYCPSEYGCRGVVEYLEENLEQRFVISGNVLRATFSFPMNAKVWVKNLIFVTPGEYDKTILNINPIDLTKKYIRKCAGKPVQLLKDDNVMNFCKSAVFELTIGEGLSLKACSCNTIGSDPLTQCDPYDGTCTCRYGFTGKDCSECITGKFPNCRARNYDVEMLLRG